MLHCVKTLYEDLSEDFILYATLFEDIYATLCVDKNMKKLCLLRNYYLQQVQLTLEI